MSRATCSGCGRDGIKVAPSGLCVVWSPEGKPSCATRFWLYVRHHSEYRVQLSLNATRVLRDKWLEAGAP